MKAKVRHKFRVIFFLKKIDCSIQSTPDMLIRIEFANTLLDFYFLWYSDIHSHVFQY